MASESLRGRVATVTPAVPLDLVIVLVSLAVADAVLIGLSDPPLLARAVVGGPLLFLLPGYAVVSALFPGRRRRENSGQVIDGVRRQVPGGRAPSTGERVAMAFGLSVALLPFVGIVLGETVGFGLEALVAALSAVVVVGVLAGALRRLRLPTSERYRTPLGTWLADGWRAITGAESVGLAGARLILAVLVVTSVAGLGYAMVSAGSGDGYTDLMLLTEDEDGEYVASGYPTELATGEPTPLTARVANHEGEPVEYTVVVQLQTVDERDGNLTVAERTELAREQEQLASDEVWTWDHDLRASEPGEDRRVTYLVYRGEAPTEANTSSAYRHAHLWVDVVDRGE